VIGGDQVPADEPEVAGRIDPEQIARDEPRIARRERIAQQPARIDVRDVGTAAIDLPGFGAAGEAFRLKFCSVMRFDDDAKLVEWKDFG